METPSITELGLTCSDRVASLGDLVEYMTPLIERSIAKGERAFLQLPIVSHDVEGAWGNSYYVVILNLGKLEFEESRQIIVAELSQQSGVLPVGALQLDGQDNDLLGQTVSCYNGFPVGYEVGEGEDLYIFSDFVERVELEISNRAYTRVITVKDIDVDTNSSKIAEAVRSIYEGLTVKDHISLAVVQNSYNKDLGVKLLVLKSCKGI